MKNFPLLAVIESWPSSFLRRSKNEKPVFPTVGRVGKWCCLWGILGLALASPAKAAVIYQTDFSGTAGTLPASWYNRNSGTGTTALNGTGQLVYTGGTGHSATYWTGNSGTITGGVMGDAKITSLLQWPATVAGGSNPMSIGIMGRTQDETVSNPQGYFIGLYRNSNTNSLIIAKDPVTGTFTTISSVGFNFVVGTQYLLEATFIGSELTATLYDAAGINILATVSATDTSYTSGVFGVRARNPSATDRVYSFDNYIITAVVPEPSSVAMLVGAGAFIGFIALSRSKTRC